MPQQTKNERTLWEMMMNAPGAEALALYAEATKILTARNLIKVLRTRKPPQKAVTSGTTES